MSRAMHSAAVAIQPWQLPKIPARGSSLKARVSIPNSLRWGRTQSSLRPQKGPGVLLEVCRIHSASQKAHDVVALTPRWSDLDQELDPGTVG
jgi:hypothetical protein